MPFYREPPELLSQGDLISDIPWGLVEAPITLCRPVDATKSFGRSNYTTVEDWRVPGGPQAWARKPEVLHAVARSGWVLSLWHDCQIEKAQNQNAARSAKAFSAVAAVVPLTTFQEPEVLEAIRDRRHHTYFPLPAIETDGIQLPESAVDFKYIWSIKQSVLLKNRKASLSAEALNSLYEHLFVFFTRIRLDLDVKCPSCGTAIEFQRAGEER